MQRQNDRLANRESPNSPFLKKLQAFAFGKPVLFSVLLFLVAMLLTELSTKNLYLPFMELQYATYLGGITEQGLTSLGLILLLAGLGLLKEIGWTAPPARWRDWWIGWPLVVLTLLNAASLFEGALTIDTSRPLLILLYTLLYLSVGLIEELLARGVILFVMLRKWGHTQQGIYLSAIVSSAIFGLAHLINYFQQRGSLEATLTQVAYATFFGVIFAACMLRNKSIWPVILLHAAFDFAGNLPEIAVGGGLLPPTTTTPEEALVTLLITFPLFLYGLFLLRKVAPLEPPSERGMLLSPAQ